jgi:putative membrane protein
MEHTRMAPLFAFLHHLAAFSLFAALVVEFVLLRDALTLNSARKILLADMILGIAAASIFIVGLGRVFHFEKGAYYYFHNWPFIAKLSLFVLLAVASIVPTREFLSWRSAVKKGQLPVVEAPRLRSIRTIIHLELVGIVVILLCAALMAKGVGTTL